MTGGNDLNDRLAILADFIPRVGGEIVDEIEGRTSTGAVLEGYRCLHGDHDYAAFSADGWDFVNVRKELNIDALWHVRTEHGRQEEGRFEVSPEELQQARQELEAELQGQPPRDKRELRLNLKQIVCREGCSANFDTTDDPLNIHGVTLDRKVHASDDGAYDIRDFGSAVQNVIGFVWTAQDLIEEYYGLSPSSTGGSDYRIS